MTLYEFNALSENERYYKVHNEGTFIDVVIQGVTKYVLYSLGMFWVQITYNTQTNQQTQIQYFTSGHLLERFSNAPDKL